jgi:glycosyltransferase involved in cell wall biosynthesis
VKYAKKYAKPVFLLPHFHFDDEFYHWRSYYEALQQADGVLAAPKESIRLFYEKIKAKTEYVPGGLSPEEFANVDGSAFRKVYPSPLPFVLFLGRKSGAKNYQWIIEAVKEINRSKKICDLVMIGKDEDGAIISEAEAFYLGQQPREVVLGALKECLCLINMSESESFGIVLLEARMFKRPVIANGRCAAFKELVIDGVNGLLASKNDLAEKIHFVISHPREAEIMGDAGHKAVSQSYTWPSIAGSINDLLVEMSYRRLQ